MLASITPLGERGRGSTWAVTVAAFMLGATTAGALLGACLGALGAVLLGTGVGERPRLIALALALALGLVLDLRPGNAPGPSRQVNERWLDEFRGWVYGLGFGTQLGFAVTTIVTSAATYAALLGAFLAGGPAAGALILGCYGAVRGLTLFAAAHVRRPEQLMRMHAALERWRRPAARVRCCALALICILAAALALS